MRALIVAGSGLLLAGCAETSGVTTSAPTQAELDTLRHLVAGDPAVRKAEFDRCLAKSPRQTPLKTANMGVIMGVAPDQVKTVFCERIVHALQTGRPTAAHVRTSNRGKLNPTMLAVIQGR